MFSGGNGLGQVAIETTNKTACHLKLTITKETAGHVDTANNYRPISILPTPMKMFGLRGNDFY